MGWEICELIKELQYHRLMDQSKFELPIGTALMQTTHWYFEVRTD